MLAVLAITSPIFLLIGLGYLAVRGGAIGAEESRGLGQFVLGFALPAMLFHALAQSAPADIVNPAYLAAYGIAAAVMMALGLLHARLRGKDRAAGAITGMGMAFSNSGFVGYPIVLQFLGPRGLVAVAMAMIVENTLLMTSTIAIAESGRHSGVRAHVLVGTLLARLARNPIILALVAGTAVSALGVALPVPVAKAIEMLAQASAPVALFTIGAGLVGLKIDGMIGDAAAIAIGKLILHPLLVFGLLLALPPFEPHLMAGAVVLAACPMLSVFPLFGRRYGQPHLSAAAMLATTAVSFATISTILWLLTTTAVFGPLP